LLEKKKIRSAGKIPVSLIGVGGYGAKLTDIIKRTQYLEIVSCYHPDRDRSCEVASKIGCKPALSEKEAVCNNDVEAVIIASPDYSHLRYILLAIENNCHIFVEKPMVSTWEEALIVKKKLASHNGVFFVGHNMRREAGFRLIKKEYDAGLLGQLVTFHINLSHGGAFNWSKNYWRANPALCREGPLRVNGVHASDVLEFIFGPIDSVHAKLASNYSHHSTPDSGFAMLQIGKAIGSVSTNWNVPSINSFQFQFTNAIIDYDLKKYIIRYGRDKDCLPTPSNEVSLPEVDSRREQIEEFAAAILGESMVETGFLQGERAVMFFESCYRSNERNQSVRLEELLS